MFILSVVVVHLVLISSARYVTQGYDAPEYSDNINGSYMVRKGHHYSNKTKLIWGQNEETEMVFLNYSLTPLSINRLNLLLCFDIYQEVSVVMPRTAAIYNCTSTCDDPIWMYDWNKLWGKARCGEFILFSIILEMIRNNLTLL